MKPNEIIQRESPNKKSKTFIKSSLELNLNEISEISPPKLKIKSKKDQKINALSNKMIFYIIIGYKNRLSPR